MSLIKFFKAQRAIEFAINNESVLEKLTHTFGTEFRVDWIGRIYTVINPHVQRVHDGSSLIYQYNKDNTMSNSLAIEAWIMKRMNDAAEFIRDNNFLEVLSYHIDRIDDDENYLFVLENAYIYNIKTLLKYMGIGGIAAAVTGVALALLL